MLLFKAFIYLTLVTLMAGCGFSPLYKTGEDSYIINVFSQINILPIKDRTGQLFSNEIKRLLHPRGKSEKSIYNLKVNLSEINSSLGVKKSAIATRGNLSITATYSLQSAKGLPKIDKSVNKITVSYNKFNSAWATLVAEEDARMRGIRALAQEMRHHLGVVLKKHKS